MIPDGWVHFSPDLDINSEKFEKYKDFFPDKPVFSVSGKLIVHLVVVCWKVTKDVYEKHQLTPKVSVNLVHHSIRHIQSSPQMYLINFTTGFAHA